MYYRKIEDEFLKDVLGEFKKSSFKGGIEEGESCPVYLFDSVCSTMNIAKFIAKKGSEEIKESFFINILKNSIISLKAVILAREQIKGVGRQGRKWFSGKDSGLYLTLLFEVGDKENEFFSSFSLFLGVIVREVLAKEFKVNSFLKWPNDIVVFSREIERGFKKLGGILSVLSKGENDKRFLICGIGVNLKEIGDKNRELGAISLLDLTKRENSITSSFLLVKVLKELFCNISLFSEHGFSYFRPLWEEKSFLLNKKVDILCGGKRERGVVVGVTNRGSLIIRDFLNKSLKKEICSGEVLKVYVAND